MKILVCGGRNYNDKNVVFKTLDQACKEFSINYKPNDNWLPSDITIVHGAAAGADSLADQWAVVNWCGNKPYPADWKKYGRAAGYIRNKKMLDEEHPDLVIAFPGGRGTDMMVGLAKGEKVPIWKIDLEGNITRIGEVNEEAKGVA